MVLLKLWTKKTTNFHSTKRNDDNNSTKKKKRKEEKKNKQLNVTKRKKVLFCLKKNIKSMFDW